MFDKLNELLEQLNAVNADFSKYKNAKEARLILQDIKVAAQDARVTILEESKKK